MLETLPHTYLHKLSSKDLSKSAAVSTYQKRAEEKSKFPGIILAKIAVVYMPSCIICEKLHFVTYKAIDIL